MDGQDTPEHFFNSCNSPVPERKSKGSEDKTRNTGGNAIQTGCKASRNAWNTAIQSANAHAKRL